MKSAKPKTKRYQFGGTLRSQITGARNTPPPTRPAPAPVKAAPAPAMPQRPMQPPTPTPRPTATSGQGTPTPTVAKTTFSTPAIQNPTADLGGLGGLGGLGNKGPAPGAPMTLPKGVVGDTFTPAANRTPTNLAGVLQGLQNLQKPGTAAEQTKGDTMAALAANPKLAMKKGGSVKAYAKGGKVSSASSRGDGIAQRGKTRGKMV